MRDVVLTTSGVRTRGGRRLPYIYVTVDENSVRPSIYSIQEDPLACIPPSLRLPTVQLKVLAVTPSLIVVGELSTGIPAAGWPHLFPLDSSKAVLARRIMA